jgi:hypothetical protein
MLKKIRVVFICSFVFTFLSTAASAVTVAKQDQAKLIPLKNADLHKVAEALLHRVESGVFQVQAGKSMDMTERKILLTFRGLYGHKRNAEEKKILITINGDTEIVMPGKRIDLLKHKVASKSLEGYSECFVDYVGLLTPKGVSAKATFRLHCE